MQRARRQEHSEGNGSSLEQRPGASGGSNSEAARDVPGAEAQPSLLAAVSGGEGLHAAACACGMCIGGVSMGVHPGFTQILPDGTVSQEPLGPQAEDGPAAAGGTAAPTMAGPAGAEAAASGGFTFAKHGSFPAIYGQTYYSEPALPTFPKLHFEFGRTWLLDHTCKAKATTWGEPEFPALCTPESPGEGYLVNTPQAQYPGYAHYIIVDGNAATKIAMAEEQHVQDLFMGWNLTANKVGDAINADAAGDAHEADDAGGARAACIDAIVGLLGPLGDAVRGKIGSGGEIAMPDMMNKAFEATRTKRDSSHDHSFPPVLWVADDQKKKVASRVDEKALPMTPSSAVVNYGTIL